MRLEPGECKFRKVKPGRHMLRYLNMIEFGWINNKMRTGYPLMVVEEITKMQTSINQDEIKSIIKAAIIEVLEERPDLLQEAIEGALEEVAFCRAIREGENTEPVDREVVFGVLEGKA
jgi:hypothetical protein